MSTLLSVAIAAAVGWTRLYTSGLSPQARDRRREEIASDIWESVHGARGSQLELAGQILLRLLLGIPDDLGWRRQHLSRRVVWQWRMAMTMAAIMAAALWLDRAAQPDEPVAELMKLIPEQQRGPRLIDVPPPPPPPPPPCAPEGFPQPPGSCTR